MVAGMTRWADITAAVAVALSGERDDGRRRLHECWQAIADTDHAQRCVVAHYLADLEADLPDEVQWDERALSAYQHVADTDLAPIGIPSARGLAPSLHLNLGDGYLRQGRVHQARAQLDAGVAAAHALGEDGYAAMIRKGLDGLERRVTAAEAST